MGGHALRTISGGEVALEAATVDSFAACLRGALLTPGGDGYDEARSIWNGMIDRRPGLIAMCEGTADVIATVRFAREHDLLVSVRGGGHNVSGNAVCDGGLMISLARMNAVRVDPSSRRARVSPGARLGDLDHETQAFGLVAPAGIVTTTGVAGLTLGGGFGWLSRKWALTCDNLHSVDLVTSEGELVRASADENADLFWGLRGGGGNFGIATSFELGLHPFGPEAAAGLVFHPIGAARDLLAFFRDFLADAPEEVTGIFLLRTAPPAPFLPPEFHGKPVAAVGACYAGPAEAGMKALDPLKRYGSPIGDILFPKPFVQHQRVIDAGQPSGSRYYWKSEYFTDLPEALIDVLISHAETFSSPLSVMALFQVGGAVARVGEDETAYGHRGARFAMNVNAQWLEASEDETHLAWARRCWQATRSFSTGGGYINFQSQDEGDDRVQASYGDAKFARLTELKARYDPNNFFRMNQNIPARR